MEKIRKQIVSLVKRSERILIMPSTPVDGDSLGSALALYLAFKKIGKEVTVVCADPVPDTFQFLPTTKVISDEFTAANDFIVTLDCQKAKIKTIRTKLERDKVNIIITAKKGQFSSSDVSFSHGPHKYDLIITVDTGDLEQLGRFYEDNPELFVNLPLINIDHHASNSNFGKINYIDIMSSSTTELLIPLIEDFEEEFDKKLIDEDTATLLLAGIVTDTGSFQNANTTPRSFANAAFLIKHGARQQEIIQHIFKTKNLSTLRLWGRILTKMKIDEKHRIVWSTISSNDFRDTGSTDDETGGIIDELMSNAPGTEIVLLLKQKENKLVSGSLRTTSAAIDASSIAEMFSGGGHVQAAGFRIESGDINKVEESVINKIREFQKKRLGLTDEASEFSTEISPETTEEIIKTTKYKDLEELSVDKSTPLKKEKKSTTKTTKQELKNEKSETTKTSVPDEPGASDEEETFTDVIIKKGKRDDADNGEDEEIELKSDVIYKFED